MSTAKYDNAPKGAPGRQADLAAREAFNFALFQHSPDATTIVDAEGRVLKSNLARRNSGVPLPPLGELLFGDSDDAYSLQMRTLLMQSIESGRIAKLPEIRHAERYEAVTIAPVADGAIVITGDITARKLAEEEAIHAQKLAALGTMVSGMAHEVSNPNNIMILGTTALRKLIAGLWPVLDRYRELEGDFNIGRHAYEDARQEMPELVDAISRAADRIDILVKDLKDYARKEVVDRRTSVDLNELVRASVTMLHAIIKKGTRHFSINCCDSLPGVLANGPRIEQVMVNLITNALEALPDRNKAVAVTISYDRESDCACIEVRDEGDGISGADMARITDPFFTTKHDTGGTGLGLSISRKIVETHGGSLTFSSEAGQGTCATIVLPCKGSTPND